MRLLGISPMKIFLPLGIALAAFSYAASANAAEDPSITACKSTGLLALQQKSADITDLVIDQESIAVSAADTKVEDVPVKTVVLGEAYIQRGKATDKPDRFVCLIGDKGKVLLTFFTAK
jgi:hypothetical protein